MFKQALLTSFMSFHPCFGETDLGALGKNADDTQRFCFRFSVG
jgi:hypothetical protein